MTTKYDEYDIATLSNLLAGKTIARTYRSDLHYEDVVQFSDGSELTINSDFAGAPMYELREPKHDR